MEISNNSVLFQEEIVIKLFLTSPKKVLYAKTGTGVLSKWVQFDPLLY